ncbi:MAG: PAS domain S-box protein [Candidatus Schekmanbacteria bacterium]|nr:PAS domain S-box protein [Candidatus Schekmanbacteria bacterium]
MINKNKIRTYLFYVILLLIISSIAILSYSAYLTVETQVADNFNQHQLILAREAAAGIENYTGSIQNTLHYMGRDLIKNPQNYQVIMEYNWQLMANRLLYLVYIDAAGKSIYFQPAELTDLPRDFSQTAYYKTLIKQTAPSPVPYISNVYSSLSGQNVIAIAIPLYTTGNQLQGILGAAINSNKMLEIFLSPIKPGQNGFAWLLDNNGNLLYHPHHEEMLGKNIFTSRGCEPCHPDFNLEKRLAASIKGGTVITYIPQSNQRRLLAYHPVRIGPRYWLVAVETPYMEVISLIESSFKTTSTLAVAIIFIILLTCLYMVNLQKKRVEVEKEAKDLRDLLEAISENSPIEIAIVDTEERYVYVNHFWEQISGVDRMIILGQQISEVQPALYENETFHRLFHQALQTGKPQGNIEISFLARIGIYNGKQVYKIFWIIPLSIIEKTVVRCALIGYNITELKRMERQLIQSEKLAASGKLAAGIAHEINNPLYGIQGCLDYLRKNLELNERDKKFVELSYQETERINKLLRMMHDFYHPSEEAMKPVAINELVRDVLILQQPALQQKQISLKTYFTEGIPLVLASGDQLKQVFINLINNAQDAMERGGELTITTYMQDNNEVISFSDTGPGVPDNLKEKVFEAFFTTKEEVKGVGLGLSVSYGIIKRHNGDIIVENAVPQGAKFLVKLPAMV